MREKEFVKDELTYWENKDELGYWENKIPKFIQEKMKQVYSIHTPDDSNELKQVEILENIKKYKDLGLTISCSTTPKPRSFAEQLFVMGRRCGKSTLSSDLIKVMKGRGKYFAEQEYLYNLPEGSKPPRMNKKKLKHLNKVNKFVMTFDNPNFMDW